MLKSPILLSLGDQFELNGRDALWVIFCQQHKTHPFNFDSNLFQTTLSDYQRLPKISSHFYDTKQLSLMVFLQSFEKASRKALLLASKRQDTPFRFYHYVLISKQFTTVATTSNCSSFQHVVYSKTQKLCGSHLPLIPKKILLQKVCSKAKINVDTILMFLSTL